jgi:hypothetical protein
MPERRDDLLNWYLAQLRKNALTRKKFQDLTPMALVESDKEMLKQIVEESAQIDVLKQPVIANILDNNYWMIQLALTVIVTGTLLVTLIFAP